MSMWWVKVLALLLVAAAIVALFRGLGSLVRGESADGRTVRALAWRIGLSVAAFLFLIVAMWMGWLQPHDVRYTERYGEQIEQSEALHHPIALSKRIDNSGLLPSCLLPNYLPPPLGGGLNGIGKLVTLLPLASEILATPSFSTSSIRIIACMGMNERCTPANSPFSRSSEGSTTTWERSPKRNSSTSIKPYKSL